MDVDSVKIQLHHCGEFGKMRYSGGKVETFYMDRDRLSYCELMEYVKELDYTEIGGIYIKRRGWTLVTDDRGVNEATNGRSDVDFYIDTNVDKSLQPMKQMQPHVIVRPRSSPYKVKENNAEKRTFVTLKDINDEKERRISTRKKLHFNHGDMSSTFKPSQKGAVEASPKVADQRSSKATVREVDGSGAGHPEILESGGSKEMAQEVEGEGCNEYEKKRNKNIAENKAKLQALGFCQTKSASQKEKCKDKQPNENGGESDYVPDDDHEPGQQSEGVEDDIGTSKVGHLNNKIMFIASVHVCTCDTC